MNIHDSFGFQKGDRLDGMTVVSFIVRGGHGDLYLVNAEDGRKLILKVIQKLNDEGEFSGIEKCRAILSHIPRIVPVLKVGRIPDGRVYCVMPPADNLAQWPDYKPDTFAERIRRNGRLQPEEVLDLADKMLATVKALHKVGLAHCDIKPENIVFINGEPKLTDYSLFSDTLNQSVDAPFGTMGFVPPEMVGNPDGFKPEVCDRYAVGKVIYCAWSGMDAMLFPSVPQDIPLPEIGVMLPIYMKACSDYPNRRFSNEDEFISAISVARSRLHGRFLTRGLSFSRRYAWFLFNVLSMAFFCVAVLFFLYVGKKAEPLTVTTVLDIVDENDGAVSLCEALSYAQAPGGARTIRFNMKDGDDVSLREPSLITRYMRFATTNESNGKPVSIMLDHLNISGRKKSTPEGEDGGGAVMYAKSGCFSVLGGEYAWNGDDGPGGYGGVFRLNNSSFAIDGAVFRNNHAFSSGGALCLERTNATIKNAQFSGNRVNGFGGAIRLIDSEVRIVNSCFVNNSTDENSFYGWSGGAIQVENSNLIYDVPNPTFIILNENNRSGSGGFISLCVTDSDHPKSASVEFRIAGTTVIGDQKGTDSFSSRVRIGSSDYPAYVKDISGYDIFIRKTGAGLLSIQAPVNDYDGKWLLEDGCLVFDYPGGGDFDGEIIISGGQMKLNDPYAFKKLTFRLGSETNGLSYINALSRLTGGLFYVDVSGAADGTYLLADGADSFDGAMTLQIEDSSKQTATVSIGETVQIGGSRYTLNRSEGILSLTVRR